MPELLHGEWVTEGRKQGDRAIEQTEMLGHRMGVSTSSREQTRGGEAWAEDRLGVRRE